MIMYIEKWRTTKTGRFEKYDGFNWYECEPEEIIQQLQQENERLKKFRDDTLKTYFPNAMNDKTKEGK